MNYKEYMSPIYENTDTTMPTDYKTNYEAETNTSDVEKDEKSQESLWTGLLGWGKQQAIGLRQYSTKHL